MIQQDDTLNVIQELILQMVELYSKSTDKKEQINLTNVILMLIEGYTYHKHN